MDVFSFYRVFSILLDNAIEGASTTSNSYISIVFIQDKNIQEILRRIVQDEEVHIGILTALYHKYFR